MYNSEGKFSCLNYIIETNSFSEVQKILDSQCNYNGGSLIMEYFQEKNEFIVGYVGNNVDFYLAEFSQELTFKQQINTNNDLQGDNLVIINIILPNGAHKYTLYFIIIKSLKFMIY